MPPEANNPNRLEDDTGAQSGSATDLSAEIWWTNPTQGIDAEILPVNAVGAAAESRANSPLAMARHLSPHSRHRDPQLIASRLSGSAKRLGGRETCCTGKLSLELSVGVSKDTSRNSTSGDVTWATSDETKQHWGHHQAGSRPAAPASLNGRRQPRLSQFVKPPPDGNDPPNQRSTSASLMKQPATDSIKVRQTYDRIRRYLFRWV
ncbi:hypothetical protein MCOR27_003114 [Pyricularia oryzae]|nr:hypothetical protein MCOR27_003114 [Pyricularia oryzae]KAI6591729.1 hypothetical protein MCOR06_004500 [Pyricularia oryzae]